MQNHLCSSTQSLHSLLFFTNRLHLLKRVVPPFFFLYLSFAFTQEGCPFRLISISYLSMSTFSYFHHGNFHTAKKKGVKISRQCRLPLHQSPLYKSFPVTVFRVPNPWGSSRWPLVPTLTARELKGRSSWHTWCRTSSLVIALTSWLV